MKIALTGKMRSGKSTVAEYLKANYGFTEFAFGDALKRFVHAIFGESSAKDRDLYQWFGQTMRSRDPDVWVRRLDEAVCDHFKSRPPVGAAKRVVVSDLRQPNEYEYLRREGYTIIRINCPEDIRVDRILESGDYFEQSMLDHETEWHVDTFDVDFEVENSGRWIDMAEQVDVIMRELGVSMTKEAAK